jgi:hypothetical protein
MTRFFDAHIRPPKGGWSFPIGGTLVTRYSENDITDEIRKWRQNNGTYTSDAAITEELWAYYCARDPGRCGIRGEELKTLERAKALPPAEKTPEMQGRPIWMFLNTIAAQWLPGTHDYFLATCDAIIVILECPKCREEWRSLLAQFPPAALKSRFEVCRWVNKVHNEVNSRLGKSSYPYSRMVSEYAAPAE